MKPKTLSFVLPAALLFFSACGTGNGGDDIAAPADTGNSDARAAAVAEEMVRAMGGWENWHNTRHISWNFFGSRTLLWDKQTGNVRIEHHRNNLLFLMNINDTTGRVWHNGTERTATDSLKEYLLLGERIWVNDSYWLIMPFKLRDPGAILKYRGEGLTEKGDPADIIELTFEETAGFTPENRYVIYADKKSRLVSQWDFYANRQMESPSMVTSWEDYKKHGNILLSGKRGDRSLSNIMVFDHLPEFVYTDTASVNLSSLDPLM